MKVSAYIFAFFVLLGGKANALELYDRDSANERLMPILSALKDGIRKRDVSLFEDYVLFPLNISFEEKYDAADGSEKLRTKKFLILMNCKFSLIMSLHLL